MTTRSRTTRGGARLLLVVGVALAAAGVERFVVRRKEPSSLLLVAVWSVSQWMPVAWRRPVQRSVWERWERREEQEAAVRRGGNSSSSTPSQQNFPVGPALEIPTVDVQKHRSRLLPYLEATYGKDWRDRPLLLKGLWTLDELERDPDRTLSVQGLLRETNRIVPYYTDARRRGALTPDAKAPLSAIVSNITQGFPHKIGSQKLVQDRPDLIREVAPIDVVTVLFGDHFSPQSLEGWGPWKLFPPLTTVPLFVAGKRLPPAHTGGAAAAPPLSPSSTTATDDEEEDPHTALHCEPIGNVAVQLSGWKEWTLVAPEHWHLVRPHRSPDDRAFFASGGWDDRLVPTYRATTSAGDALWVPTWTWHRVTYPAHSDIAIGASLFHFRPYDFVVRNPVLAALIVPSLILELVGYNTQ